MTNLPATISTLNQQIGVLTEKLHPVTEEQVARSIKSLIASGLPLPSSMQPDKAPDIYGFALAGVPSYGLQKAIAKVIRGEYDINRSFAPTPPELAAMARAEAKVIRDDKARLIERKEALEGPQTPPQVSEEAKERIRKALVGFRQHVAASKGKGMAAEIPMSPEQAAYYQKIMSLRDADGVGAEQLAYRTAISRKVDAVQPNRTGED